MGILAAHREAKAKEVENLLSIADHHRELWDEAINKADLQRVFQTDVDLSANPVTVTEEEFLNLVITHWLTSWRVANAGGIITVKELGIDASGFFSLPLPRAIWEKTKRTRNPKFVRFIERAIENQAPRA